MITVRYKGEIVKLDDVEVTWVECDVHDGLVEKTGNIEEYAEYIYSEAYDAGFDEGSYQDN